MSFSAEQEELYTEWFDFGVETPDEVMQETQRTGYWIDVQILLRRLFGEDDQRFRTRDRVAYSLAHGYATLKDDQ